MAALGDWRFQPLANQPSKQPQADDLDADYHHFELDARIADFQARTPLLYCRLELPTTEGP